jgi:exopolyphosphatase / guanosine-5'-triphosphate,3'-diphosphate pyrophosphatase
VKPAPVAVIDLGSNTARVVVFRIEREGTFQVVADSKVPLRLIRQFDSRGMLREEACRRTLRVLRDFRQLAAGAGAKRIIAVATAAVREAANGVELLARIKRETALAIRLLPPEAEARCAFLGAVYGTAAEHGLVLDIGGGSLQIGHFRDRRLQKTWSLPLGALRASERFLTKNPPGKQEIRRLAEVAAATLTGAGVPALREDELLIGTGGTIRNLGKIDARLRGYPITRLHGYVLAAGRTRTLNELLRAKRGDALMLIPGLNSSRSDSILGGGLLAETTMKHVGAGSMLVAGLGLREGLILETRGLQLPRLTAVRASAVHALVSCFSCWDDFRAARRTKIVQKLYAALLPTADPFQVEMTALAATVLDIGRSVEYYRRHEHAAMILRSAGLNGFGHREVLYLSLIIELAESIEWRERNFKPLLRNGDLDAITRSAIVLSLADEIEHRIPANRSSRLRCRVHGSTVVVNEPALSAWEPGNLAASFERWFGRKLRISG